MDTTCPHCGKHLRSKPEWAGRTATCKSCNGRFVIPAPSPSNDDEVHFELVPPSESSKPLARPAESDENPFSFLNEEVAVIPPAPDFTAASPARGTPPELPKENARATGPARLPGWCRAFLTFDVLWSWLVLALVIVAMVVVDRSREGVIVHSKEWVGVGLFVALVTSIANLRLLRLDKSSVWFGAFALGLTLIEQWVRAEENTHPQWLFVLLIVGSLAYDGLYVLSVLRVRKAIQEERLGV